MTNEETKTRKERMEKDVTGIKDLGKLFESWKEYQDEEVDRIDKEIKRIKKETGRSEGDIFEHDLYKAHWSRNTNTISSHFVQFFYKQCHSSCQIKPEIKIDEEKLWKHVLKHAFNPDGCVGTLDIKNNGYKYIFLLKEANDASKMCLRNYETCHIEDKNVNKWLQDWKDPEKSISAPMLDKLHKVTNQYLKDKKEIVEDLSKEEFVNAVAYMNVNKRGGTTETSGRDQTAVIKYAREYQAFIKREIYLLAGENTEVIVFVAGNKDYFNKLMKALGVGADFRAYKYKDKTVRFVDITHPSKPGLNVNTLVNEMGRNKKIQV